MSGDSGRMTLPSFPLMDQQLELEERMVVIGRTQFYRDIDRAKERGEESNTPYGIRLLQAAILPVSEGIVEFVAEARSGKPGRRHVALKLIEVLEPEVMAYLSVKFVLDGITKRDTLQRVAMRIADAVQDQVLLDKFQRTDKDRYSVTMETVKDATTRRRKQAISRLMANRIGLHKEPWSASDKVHLGQKLIEIIQQKTGLVTVTRLTEGHHDTALYVSATDKTMQWIDNVRERLEVMSPQYLPMIVPPKPWTNAYDGGYWSGLVFGMRFIKTRNRNYLEDAANLIRPEVFAAVNAMQDSPWKINGGVLEVMKAAWESDMAIKGMPPREPLPLPPRPANIDTDAEALKDWKGKAARVYSENASLVSKRIQFRKTVEIADEFASYERIYFPYTLDFRGRSYAVAMFLNPQGPDAAKALLTFADGKPIDDGAAAGWLAVHGANTYGFDKATLDERIQWTFDHEKEIKAAATDPLGEGYEFWTKADKPWQFLAFCLEWAAFLAHGYGFVSCLPVSLDGTCNGLQHYSAALRDPVGGAATNLIPSEYQADIYASVAEVTARYVTAFAYGQRLKSETLNLDALEKTWEERNIDSRSMAERWLAFGIDRKITKRSVMTLPYGCSQYSCREFIEEAIKEKIKDGAANVFAGTNGNGLFDASLWLQPLVWAAIGEVVQAARKGMDWLKQCAKLVAAEDVPVTWETPDGFLVYQDYRDTKPYRIKTHIDGQAYRVTLRDALLTTDKKRQQSGIAPNWVHSMDATALRMFVNMAKANGVDHFALVHDSYGSLAADMPVVSTCIRRAFVKLYTEQDPLAMFRVDVAATLPDGALPKLPPVPHKGNLDVSLVEASEFFFA